MAQHLSISNGQMSCPACNSLLVIYGSAAGSAARRLYAAECSNLNCLLLLRFCVEIQSIVRPARATIREDHRQ